MQNNKTMGLLCFSEFKLANQETTHLLISFLQCGGWTYAVWTGLYSIKDPHHAGVISFLKPRRRVALLINLSTFVLNQIYGAL